MAGAWVQIALEQEPNTEGGTSAVSSNAFYVRCDSVKIAPKPDLLEEAGKTSGVVGPAPHLGAGGFDPEFEIKGLACRPADLGLVLGWFNGMITTTPGGTGVTDPDAAAVPAGCFKHVIGRSEDTPKTAQLIAKDAGGQHWIVRGAGAKEVSVGFDGSALSIDVSGVALYAKELVDPALTPSFEAYGPFTRGDVTVEWLPGGAETKDFDAKFAVDLETSHGLGSGTKYPDLIVFPNEKTWELTGTITKRTISSVDRAALDAGTQFAAKVKLAHSQDIGATGRAAGAWIEMPGCQYTSEDPDDIKNVLRRETKYEWAARTLLSAGTFAIITVVNATAAYETYV